MDANSLIAAAAVSFVTSLAAKGSEGPAKTLDDLWYLCGFGSLHEFVEQKRASAAINLERYKQAIIDEVSNIPSENLQEPSLSIVGPALEASKYYIDKEIIRNMYAKLIAASMDKSKEEQVHGSYVEIIKQLSPLDAQNLRIYKSKHIDAEPIAQYVYVSKNKQHSVVMNTNVFLSNSENHDIPQNSISITNLSRLGLLAISYSESITGSTDYDRFLNTPEYKQLNKNLPFFRKTFESLKGAESHLPQKNLNALMPDGMVQELVVQNGIARLTPLGSALINICC